MTTAARFPFPYFVEYIDEYGVTCTESWSQETLDRELQRGDVTIIHVELSAPVKSTLGLA